MQKTRTIVYCGMLAALGAILAGPLGFKVFLSGTYSLNISFGLIPGMFGGILMGPLYGAAIGAVTDIIKYLITGMGAYDPFFTFTFALMCTIPAVVARSSRSYWRIASGVALSQALGSMILNNLWFYLIYNFTLANILIRMITPAIMIFPFSLLLFGLLKYERLLIAPRPRPRS